MKHLSTLFTALVLWSAAGPQGVVAQDQRGDRPAVDQKTTESRHEILPYIRGGVSTLHYKVDNGSRRMAVLQHSRAAGPAGVQADAAI